MLKNCKYFEYKRITLHTVVLPTLEVYAVPPIHSIVNASAFLGTKHFIESSFTVDLFLANQRKQNKMRDAILKTMQRAFLQGSRIKALFPPNSLF